MIRALALTPLGKLELGRDAWPRRAEAIDRSHPTSWVLRTVHLNTVE